MGTSCCFRIRDDPSETPYVTDPRNHWNSELQSILNKVKYIFHRNKVHHTHSTQRLIDPENLNISSCDALPNIEQKPPGVVVIPGNTAASINAEVTAETQNTRACHEHTNVVSGHQQSSEQYPEVDLIIDKAATSVDEGVTADILRTSSCHQHLNIESGHHQSSEQNPEVELIIDKAAASVDEEITADILSTSSCHEHSNAESGQSSEQNHRVDAILDKAAASVNAEVSQISNASSCHVHQNVESGRTLSSEQNPETVKNINETTRTLSQDEVLPTQTEVNSCTREVSPKLEKPWTVKVENIFFHEIFPSPDEEDECPTCLEDYDSDNPKIVAECSHHFHLSCIYEWLERSERCPVCDRLMVIDGITE